MATAPMDDPYEDMDSDETPSVRKFFKASKAMTASQSTTPKRVSFAGLTSPASSTSSTYTRSPSPAAKKSKISTTSASVSAAKKPKTSMNSNPTATSGQCFSQPNQETIKTYERKTKRAGKKLYSSDVLQGLMNESP